MPAYRTRETATRGLEVTTDAPFPPPAVTIISPTPRAFTFPIHDVPYASSSSSPFEPDLKPVPARTPPPLPRTLSPCSSIDTETSSIFSTPSAAASQASHRRRRSTASDIGERRPKKGDDDYIKRPENAFILFRRKCCEDRQAQEEAEGDGAPVKKQRQADLSKMISQQWKGLSTEERQYWEELAKEKKKEHEQMYPNYVYRPQRVKRAKKVKGREEQDADAESAISFVLPIPSRSQSPSKSMHGHLRVDGQGRRAASAPTPPPGYRGIQLPSVYPIPSCPTSPRAIPRISRRTPLPNVPPPSDCDPLMHFEFLPNDAQYPPSFAHNTTFEGQWQPSAEMLQSMFNMPEQITMHDGSARMLHALSIPQDPTAMHAMMSPADSIHSNFVSPVDSFMSSPGSTQGGPFTPADALAMNLLPSTGFHDQRVEDIPEEEAEQIASQSSAYGLTLWQGGSVWRDDEPISPDDFSLDFGDIAIPPLELPPAPSHNEQQLGALSNQFQGCDFQDFTAADFPSAPECGDDYHDTTPGPDPFSGMFSTYESTNW